MKVLFYILVVNCIVVQPSVWKINSQVGSKLVGRKRKDNTVMDVMFFLLWPLNLCKKLLKRPAICLEEQWNNRSPDQKVVSNDRLNSCGQHRDLRGGFCMGGEARASLG